MAKPKGAEPFHFSRSATRIGISETIESGHASVVCPVDPQPLRTIGERTARWPEVSEVFLPTIGVWSSACGCQAQDSPPLVSRLSVRAGRAERRPLCRAAQGEGLVGVLGGQDGGPGEIPDTEIDAIRALVNSELPASPYPYLQTGQRVRITEGPLTGVEGMLVDRRAGQSLWCCPCISSAEASPSKWMCIGHCGYDHRIRRGFARGRKGDAMRVLQWACCVLTMTMLVDPATVRAQLLQGIPRSPIETMSGSTERMPEGIYLMPWLATGVVYDDNVFFSTRDRRQEDVFLRVTPGLQGSYQSTRLTVIANYRFDSEVYNKFSELSTVQQRQFGTVELRGRPSNNLNLNGIVGYAQTRTPYELNFLTSAQTARFKTERILHQSERRVPHRFVDQISRRVRFFKDIFADEVTSIRTFSIWVWNGR